MLLLKRHGTVLRNGRNISIKPSRPPGGFLVELGDMRRRDTVAIILAAIGIILFAVLCAGMSAVKVMAFMKYLCR